jgi:hypothetical protein
MRLFDTFRVRPRLTVSCPTMPPLRYAGREAVTALYAAVPYASPDDFAFLPTRANRQPAVIKIQGHPLVRK